MDSTENEKIMGESTETEKRYHMLHNPQKKKKPKISENTQTDGQTQTETHTDRETRMDTQRDRKVVSKPPFNISK
jgi:hypothetical protein